MPSLRSKASFLICLLAISLNGFAQVVVQGKVTDKESGEGLPFVSIVFVSANDSTQIDGVVTDLEGNYRFDNI